MLYDYGPLRFSLWRGIALTVAAPFICAGVLCIWQGLLTDSPPQALWSDSLSTVRDQYIQYPLVALLFHAGFFLKGVVYRRRYFNFAPLVLMLGLSSAAYAIAFRSAPGDDGPIPSLSSLSFDTLLTPKPGSDHPPTSSGRAAPPANPPSNPIALQLTVPNALTQGATRVAPVLTARPDSDGRVLVNGHISGVAVAFEFSPTSPLSAAHPSVLSPNGRCSPSRAVIDGQTIEGCTAMIEDLDIGPIELASTPFFLTASMPARRAVIGSDLLAQLLVTRSPDGTLVIKPKPKTDRRPA